MTAKMAEKITALADQGMLDLGDETLEYRMIGPRPDATPTIVMLHEGLGCVGMWSDFPDKVAAATGCGVFVYSRKGYGKSSPVQLPRQISYMHEEAEKSVPRVLDAIGFQRGILLGHSDGASIAAIYAGTHQDHRVLGLVLMAPHFIVEDLSVKSIAEAREAYNNGDLRARLAKYHPNVDVAFRGWNDVWLDNDFRQWDISEELAYIRVPILIVQGEDDQYGTLRQIEIANEECYCPVDVALLPGVKHQPHREGAEATLQRVTDFTHRVLHGQDAEALPAV
jgi:pimeloyl-ACP methyl ester carboxylesterase